MKKNKILFLLLLNFGLGFCQLKVNSFEEIDSLQKIENRKIIVFIHSDWCKYCQVMKSKTFRNPKIELQLNDNFYYVDLNAEEKRKITFNKQSFQFKPNGSTSGIHELAIQLGTINNQITYPTLCILNKNYVIIFQHSGYLNIDDLKIILVKIDE